MIGNSRRPRAILAALMASAILGTVPFRTAAQTPAPSQKDGDSGSEDRGKSDSPKAQSRAKAKASRGQGRARRDPPGFYMGRPIADVMSWQGADWLFRETRIEEEQPEAMLDALKIPRGAMVADVGAGPGYHSIRLARRVGPKGIVYATDLQVEMLRMLRTTRARRASPISSPSAAPRRTPACPRRPST